jgi:hypothetical protein
MKGLSILVATAAAIAAITAALCFNAVTNKPKLPPQVGLPPLELSPFYEIVLMIAYGN